MSDQSAEIRKQRREELFERPLPPGYREELSLQYAEKPADAPRNTGSTLLFQIGGVRLGLPTHIASAVRPTLHIARIPHRSGTVLLGVVAARGDILPCCSLARLLDLQQRASGSSRMLIVEESHGRRWAIPIDSVLGVRIAGDVPAADIAPVPEQWLQGSFHDDGNDYYILDPAFLFRQIALATA